MTLQNGNALIDGGAIDYKNNYDYGTLNLFNITFTNNNAFNGNGGAINTYNVNLNIINSTFTTTGTIKNSASVNTLDQFDWNLGKPRTTNHNKHNRNICPQSGYCGG